MPWLASPAASGVLSSWSGASSDLGDLGDLGDRSRGRLGRLNASPDAVDRLAPHDPDTFDGVGADTTAVLSWAGRASTRALAGAAASQLRVAGGDVVPGR